MPTTDTFESLAQQLVDEHPAGHSGSVQTYISWLREHSRINDGLDAISIRRALRGWPTSTIDRVVNFIFVERERRGAMPPAAPVPASVPDTLEIIATEMNRECFDISIRESAEEVARINVLLSRYSQALQRRIVAYQDARDSVQLSDDLAAFLARPESAVQGDSLWRGVPREVVNYYRERALELR